MSFWEKWADRVYAETDVGRSIATSIAGIIGLVTYLLWSDIAIAGFAAIIAFPIFRLFAASLHRKVESLAKLKHQIDGLQRIYNRLSTEEKSVVSVFVQAGGSVMTWSQVNNSNVPFSAVESLIQRQLLHTSMSADAITETFVLDQDLFDYAQENAL